MPFLVAQTVRIRLN